MDMAGQGQQQMVGGRMPMMGQGGMMGHPGQGQQGPMMGGPNQPHPGIPPNQILQNQMQNSPGPGSQGSSGNPGSHPHQHHPGTPQGSQGSQGSGSQGSQASSSQGTQEQPKVDSISRAKALFPTLKESVQNVFKTSSDAIIANTIIDSGTKAVEIEQSKAEKALEEFYSVCDHMEIHLKSAMECLTQNSMTQQNLPVPVSQTKMEGALTYPNYVGVVQSQIKYAKEVHDSLADAANKMLE